MKHSPINFKLNGNKQYFVIFVYAEAKARG